VLFSFFSLKEPSRVLVIIPADFQFSLDALEMFLPENFLEQDQFNAGIPL
jgi:hypothetical protein